MGKVYDALKKAEEQRSRRVHEAAASAAAAAAPPVFEPGPEALPGPAPVSRRSRPRELLQNLARVARTPRRAETAGELNKRRITLLQPESFVAEQFRSLRGRLDSLSSTRPARTIAVTSALPGDGKSLAAIGLAVVNSMQPGRRVILVDCDLRKPSVAASLGLRVDAGLAEVLEGSASLQDAVLRADGSDLDVLPVRSIPQNPSELLASEQMRNLLAALASRYDRVILDLPPTLGLPDAKTVSEMSDGVVFVVRADVTPEPEISSALDVLDRRRILGLVMNGSDPVSSRYESLR